MSDKLYVCPSCQKPMGFLKGFAVLWCSNCGETIDTWYQPFPEPYVPPEKRRRDGLFALLQRLRRLFTS